MASLAECASVRISRQTGIYLIIGWLGFVLVRWLGELALRGPCGLLRHELADADVLPLGCRFDHCALVFGEGYKNGFVASGLRPA